MKKFLFGILLALLLQPGLAYTGDIAIIVYKDNPTTDLSFKDLVKIFEQEEQYWKDNRKIYLIMQPSGRPEKETVLKKIYNKSNDEELKKFWLGKMFRGEITSFPKTLSSNEAVKRFVSQLPDSIGFIDSSFADESVKVLRIDGKLPGEKGYVLADPDS